MSIYHCPLCPLIFNYREAVERHLGEEHGTLAVEDARLRAELSSTTAPIDRSRLRELRSSEGRPSVTLVISTAPAAAMTVLDIARLRQFADRARRRLAAEPDRNAPVGVIEHRLSLAVALAETLPTDRGLVVMVNQSHIAIQTLPFAPRDRHVVDARFATRDLEYALRRHPRYRVLVLGNHPQILEGQGSQLVPADDDAFPHSDLDARLDERIDLAGPLPLVVVGEHRHLEDFAHHSRHSGAVIAEALRSRLRRSSSSALAAQAFERWLANQHQKAVTDLNDAVRGERVAYGVEAAWCALHRRVADRLWVEHDFAVPGRPSAGVTGVETTTDPAEPGVTDDLVDVLISESDRLGVPVTFLDRGVLTHPEPVAAGIRGAVAPGAQSPALSLAIS